MREGDVKAADDVDQENSWPENNTTDTQPPAAANDSMQRLEEADNIVQDALQLAENDELNEYRDVSIQHYFNVHFDDMIETIAQIDDVGEADAKASKRVAKGIVSLPNLPLTLFSDLRQLRDQCPLLAIISVLQKEHFLSKHIEEKGTLFRLAVISTLCY